MTASLQLLMSDHGQADMTILKDEEERRNAAGVGSCGVFGWGECCVGSDAYRLGDLDVDRREPVVTVGLEAIDDGEELLV
jgi:hypothetical protein